MSKAQGTCIPKFEKVRSLFDEFLASGEEFGASLTVNIDGEDVINLWGGYADEDAKQPWTEDTIVNVASCSKMVCSLAILMLVDSGAISVHDKVSKYWPEFAANGKENIEIRHLMSHTSGLSAWEEKVTIEDACDPTVSTPKLAAQAPWWEPGTAAGYHIWTYGHLLGEIIRRVTGMTLKQFIAEKITTPLGADFQLGFLEKDAPRVSHYFTLPLSGDADYSPTPLFEKSWDNPGLLPDLGQRPAWQHGEVGAANGYSNARAMNKMFSTITLAGSEGVDERKKLLSKAAVDLIFEEQSNGMDIVLGIPVRFGVGFALKGDGDWVSHWMPRGEIVYWGGAGGSLGLMDVGRKITITYTMTRRDLATLISSKTCRAYLKTVYEILGVSI